jgi:hypothetical protein
MSIKIELPRDEFRELVKYCQLNKLDINELSKKCFEQGLRIEKYGLLNSRSEVIEKEIIKEVEVIKEVPKIEYVEIVKEVPKIEYVEIVKEIPKIEYVEVVKEVPSPPVEVIQYVDKEVIKEVFIEKDVSNSDNFYDKNYVDELKQKILELENKPPEIREVPVEVVKEVVIEKEIPVEVIKEIIVEKEVVIEKDIGNVKSKMESLQNTLLKLKEENIRKEKELEENKKLIEELKKLTEDKKAVYLRGSDLNKLY